MERFKLLVLLATSTIPLLLMKGKKTKIPNIKLVYSLQDSQFKSVSDHDLTTVHANGMK